MSFSRKHLIYVSSGPLTWAPLLAGRSRRPAQRARPAARTRTWRSGSMELGSSTCPSTRIVGVRGYDRDHGSVGYHQLELLGAGVRRLRYRMPAPRPEAQSSGRGPEGARALRRDRAPPSCMGWLLGASRSRAPACPAAGPPHEKKSRPGWTKARVPLPAIASTRPAPFPDSRAASHRATEQLSDRHRQGG